VRPNRIGPKPDTQPSKVLGEECVITVSSTRTGGSVGARLPAHNVVVAKFQEVCVTKFAHSIHALARTASSTKEIA
jgi:hypothetical protein